MGENPPWAHLARVHKPSRAITALCSSHNARVLIQMACFDERHSAIQRVDTLFWSAINTNATFPLHFPSASD
eukprot:44842-Pelagomonas_calceolata.AAC.7